MILRKNTAGQFLYFTLANANGIPQTGQLIGGAGLVAKRCIDGGAQALCTGAIVEDGNGQYHVALSQADTNGDNIGFTIHRADLSGVIVAFRSFSTAEAIADTLLTRDWTAVVGEAAHSVLNALRFLRNKWSLSGTTLTVTKEDGTSPAWTSSVTTTAGANPVTGSNPP